MGQSQSLQCREDIDEEKEGEKKEAYQIKRDSKRHDKDRKEDRGRE